MLLAGLWLDNRRLSMYQIITREGRAFGSPIVTADLVLKLIPPRIRPIMLKLGMKVVLIQVQVD